MTRLLPLSLLVIGAAFAAAPVVPQDLTKGPALGPDDALIATANKDSSILPNLTYLSDEIGPRLTGSASLNKACEWAANKMRDYGLENVQLEAYTIPEGWERGTCSAKLVEPANNVHINLASAGWKPGTDGKITADVIAVTGSNIKDLEKYKGRLKGAIVMLNPPSKMPPFESYNKTGGSPFGGGGGGGKKGGKGAKGGDFNYEEYREFVDERTKLMKREGAAALLQDSGKPFGLTVTTGSWGRERTAATNKMAQLYVAHDSYAMLWRLANRGGTAKTRMELEVSNKFIPGPVKVFNVVGELRGKEKPDEFVVCGAHIDSWDLGQGTTDNGTGTCIVLETARILQRTGVRPKRTIRFCLFSGEEQGLHGSRAYVAKHKDEMAKTSVALMHDIGTGKVNGLGVGNFPSVIPILEKELVSLKPLGLVDFKSRSGGGSDHQSFQGAGVPGMLMVQDSAYYSVSHHTPADTPERLIEKDLIQGASIIAVTATRVANMDKMLPRGKGPTGKGPAGTE